MGFSRQEYWSGFPFPSPSYLPDPGIELLSPALAGRFFATEPLPLLLLLSCLSRVRHCATPKTAAHRAPLSLGFSRQEHWSGLTLPSPMRESEVAQSCPTLHDPVDCLPGSSVHGIFQVRVLEWGAIAFSDWAIREAHISLPKLNVVMSVCVSILSPIRSPLPHLVHLAPSSLRDTRPTCYLGFFVLLQSCESVGTISVSGHFLYSLAY